MSDHSDVPLENDLTRITRIIMEQIGQLEVESALCVVCNLAGQFVAHLSAGRPSGIAEQTKLLSENIRRAAIAKILYDDVQSRKEQKWH